MSNLVKQVWLVAKGHELVYTGYNNKVDQETKQVLAPDLPQEGPRLLTTVVLRAQLLRLALKGLNATEAAKIVGCHEATARVHYRDPSFRDEVRAKVDQAFMDVDEAYTSKQKGIHERLNDQALRSFEDLIGMLENPDLHPSIRMRINQDILNRVEDAQPMHKVNTTVDAAALQRAASTAREMDKVIPFRKTG